MKNPIKEVTEQLMKWGRARLIALNLVFNGSDPMDLTPYPNPFEADDETIKDWGDSGAVDAWHDTFSEWCMIIYH